MSSDIGLYLPLPRMVKVLPSHYETTWRKIDDAQFYAPSSWPRDRRSGPCLQTEGSYSRYLNRRFKED